MEKINLRTNPKILICIMVFGAISLLLSGCGSSSGNTTPSYTIPTGAGTTTTAVAANATVSAVTSASTVSPGGNFDVTINVSTDIPTRGLQLELTWDPTKVECNSVDQGTFYTSFAQQNNATVTLMPSTLAADNQIGKFPPGNDVQGTIQYNQAIFLMGGNAAADGTMPGPTGNGGVFILHMTALPNASGTINFTLGNVALSDNASNPLNPTVNNGEITITAN